MWVVCKEGELMHYGVPGMKWGHRKSIVAPTPKGRQPNWQLKKSERQKRWEDEHGINPHRPNGTKPGLRNQKAKDFGVKNKTVSRGISLVKVFLDRDSTVKY